MVSCYERIGYLNINLQFFALDQYSFLNLISFKYENYLNCESIRGFDKILPAIDESTKFASSEKVYFWNKI